MPVCRKCSRNVVSRGISCTTCGLDFHLGCLARFVGTKVCNSCCVKTYKSTLVPVKPKLPTSSSSERAATFDTGRALNTSSFLDISDLSVLSHSSADVHLDTVANPDVTLPNHRNLDLEMASAPPNWDLLTVDQKLGELFNVIMKGNSEISNKLDTLMAKVDDHDNRIAVLEQNCSADSKDIAGLKERYDKVQRYAEIRVTGIPRTCTMPAEDLVKCIFAKLNMSSDLSDVRSIRDLTDRGQSSDTAASQSQPRRAAQSRVLCIRFKSVCVRDDILRVKRAHGPLKLGDFIDNGGESLIEMYEIVSPFLHSLRLAAKTRANTLGYKHVWIRGEKVLVRKTDTSEVISIITYGDLDRIL